MTTLGAGVSFSRAELERDATRMLAYLQPPPTAESQRLARLDADVRLVSLLASAEPESALSVLDTAAQAEKNDTLAALQDAESNLRENVAIQLQLCGENLDDDDDLGDALERLAAHACRPSAKQENTSEPETEKVALAAVLNDAMMCTRLLADAESIDTAARATPHDVELQVSSLRRLAALVDEAPRRVNLASPYYPRALSRLTAMRDALWAERSQQYESALRDALKDLHWPPAEHENPDKASSSERFRLTGKPLALAWADVCEWQLAAVSIGQQAPPTALRAPASISSAERAQGGDAQPGSNEYVPLVAVQILLEPLLLRFRYHFDGERATNRLDKPEWFLAHMQALVHMNKALFEPAPDPWTPGGDVAELTRQRRVTAGSQDALRSRPIAVDAPSELLHALLLPLRQKLQAALPRLAEKRALLAHTVLQLITFDSDLRDGYAPALAAANGRGAVNLADEVLGHESWFQAWLDGERQFTEQRYERMFEADGAWALVQADTMDDEDPAMVDESDTDAVVDADTATRCAVSLVSLLAGVTERYRPLHSLLQRCAFLVQVQRPLLDRFAARLQRHLDAFENMSSAFSRALPGEIVSLSANSGQDMVRGVDGVTRVAKALLSAAYLRKQLEEWSESSFFLHMADEIAQMDQASPLRQLLSKKYTKNLVESANLTSLLQLGWQRGAEAAASLRPLSKTMPDSESSPEGLEGAPAGVWDAAIHRFRELEARSAHALERLTVSEVLELLKPYVLRRWDVEETQDQGEDVATVSDVPSRELVPALSKLSTLLRRAVQVLPPSLLFPVYRHIASSLSTAVIQRILMPGRWGVQTLLTSDARVTQQFAPSEAERFRRDIKDGWLHVARELADHPKVAARRARNIPTGLGRNPESAWATLVEAGERL